MRRRYDIEKCKQLFSEAGCKLLEGSYRDNKTPMQFRCHCGCIAKVRLNDFLRGTRCGCGREKEGKRRRHPFEFVREYFAEQGCALLESTYSGNRRLLRYRCICGNESKITFS